MDRREGIMLRESCNNIALYIAGDENIIYPALVAMTSIKKYNSNIDLFLFLPLQSIGDGEITYASNNGIKLVDISALDQISPKYISKFQDMGRWPRHIFYNWLAPTYLGLLGYKFAIKADYDMLCVGVFEIEKILPSPDQVITVLPKGFIQSKLDDKSFQKIQQDLNLEFPKLARSANVGFVVYDLNRWTELKMQDLFMQIYSYLSSTILTWDGRIVSETIEQLAFSCLQGQTRTLFKKLDGTYNFRPMYDKEEQDPKIIHFNTTLKPWVKINLRMATILYFREYGVIKQILYAKLWQDFANSLTLKPVSELPSYSIFDIARFFDRLAIDSNEIAQRKEVLLNVKDFLIDKLPATCDYKFDAIYKWMQIPVSLDGFVHFEVLFSNTIVKCVLHLERGWKDKFRLFACERLLKLPYAETLVNETELGYVLNTQAVSVIGCALLSLYFQLISKLEEKLQLK